MLYKVEIMKNDKINVAIDVSAHQNFNDKML